MRAFLVELKRRNVFRAALLYIGAIWALAQGIAGLAPELGMPDWSTRAFIVAGAIGFPFWLLFAWFYELTPEGLKRESQIHVDESITRQTGRKLDYWIIGVLTVAVVLLLTDKLLLRDPPLADALSTQPAAPPIPSASIAVLPLVNASGNDSEDYFADGLSEELIAGLSRIEGLKVIGRTSSFQFKDTRESGTSIGQKLGVAHLLEGSVRQQGERVRIVVSLLRATDGSALWSQTFDRKLDDIFEVQAEIARNVAAALQVKLSTPASTGLQLDQPPSGNAAAYQAYLQGRMQGRRGDDAGLLASLQYHREALRLDPDYVAAWFGLSLSLTNLSMRRDGEEAARYAREARDAANRAGAIAPNDLNSLIARAYVQSMLDQDPETALATAREALALSPDHSDTLGMIGSALSLLGRHAESVESFRRALENDPLRLRWRANIIWPLITLRRLDEAEREVRAVLETDANYPNIHVALTNIAAMRGDAAATREAARTDPDPDGRRYGEALAAAVAGDSAAFEAAARKVVDDCSIPGACAYNAALVHGFARKPDRMFAFLEQAAQDPAYRPTADDPFFEPYFQDPRFISHLGKYGLSPLEQ